MALPVVQKILDVIVTRLKNITADNSYEFEVGDVQVVSRDKNTWNPKPRDIYIDQKDSVLNEEHSVEGNPSGRAYDVDFEIHGFAKLLDVDATEEGVTDTNTTDNQMMAAIMKAIVNNDATGWQTFGSNAIDALFPTFGPFDGPGHDGGMVTLSVSFRFDETDPYTKR